MSFIEQQTIEINHNEGNKERRSLLLNNEYNATIGEPPSRLDYIYHHLSPKVRIEIKLNSKSPNIKIPRTTNPTEKIKARKSEKLPRLKNCQNVFPICSYQPANLQMWVHAQSLHG